MSVSPLPYLQHILNEIQYLTQQSNNLDKDDFLADETLRRAFVRSLEIIGEAARQISADIRQQYGQIEWRSIVGMRDRLIHGYFGVDYDIVWDVVINRVPELQREIEQMIEDLS